MRLCPTFIHAIFLAGMIYGFIAMHVFTNALRCRSMPIATLGEPTLVVGAVYVGYGTVNSRICADAVGGAQLVRVAEPLKEGPVVGKCFAALPYLRLVP